MTKNDLARVIILALYNLPALPKADSEVVRRYARQRKSTLEYQHKLVLRALASIGRTVPEAR